MMTMADAKPDQPAIDEKWMGEYTNWGFGEFDYYLLKQARFAAYLARKTDEEEPDGPASES
jgi:hypothetical protein